MSTEGSAGALQAPQGKPIHQLVSLLRFVDIDECREKPSVCDHGLCENTVGSYRCRCNAGFELSHNRDCIGKSVSLSHSFIHSFVWLTKYNFVILKEIGGKLLMQLKFRHNVDIVNLFDRHPKVYDTHTYSVSLQT